MARAREGVQSSQSVLLALEQELRATRKEHSTPMLLEARTMREDSLSSSHALAAGEELRDESVWAAKNCDAVDENLSPHGRHPHPRAIPCRLKLGQRGQIMN